MILILQTLLPRSGDVIHPLLWRGSGYETTPSPHPLDFVYLRMICSYRMVPYVQNLHHFIIELVLTFTTLVGSKPHIHNI